MAQFCTEQARLHGLVEEELDPGREEMGKGLADTVATEGGECCVPKSKRGGLG